MINAGYRTYLRPALRRTDDIDRLRGYLERFAPLTGRPPAGTDLEEFDLGRFTVERIFAPGADRRRFVLYFPGGGFVLRSPSIHRALIARIGHEAGLGTLLTFYRLAPEHPYPAALEDCLAAYDHLRAGGVAESDIVFGGDSAGGCLVLAALQVLRDRGERLPAGGFMLSPVTDLRGHRRGSRQTNARSDSMLTMDAAEVLHRYYVSGSVAKLSDPLVSPALGDLSGLPPLHFQVSRAEILLDDTLRVAERARAAGVECEVEVFDGMPHVWQVVPHLPESKRALNGLSEFIGKAIAAGRGRRREEQPCTTPI